MSTGVVIRLKNLAITAGTIDIRRFFSGLSIPDGGVHIIGGEDGTAFILFSTDEDARQAMLRDGQKLVNEKIKLMLSSHTEMRLMIEESQRRYEELRGLRPPEPPITNLTSRSSATGGNAQKNNQEGQNEQSSDLYCEMKGMPYNVSEDEIVEFFQNLSISAIRFMRDDKGRQSGQGFVKFKTQSAKIQALKKDRDFLGPRFVRVIPATERQWLLSGSQMCDTVRPNSNDNYPNRKRGQNNTPSNEGTPKRSRALSPIRYDNCVELRGLPMGSNYKTVQDLFYHLKFVENGLFLEMDGKHCRGRAFAEFASVDNYKEALLKDGEIVEGKQIRVINISRQAMTEQIKHHKKYMKLKREEEYKRERDEIERKEREKKERLLKEAQAKMYEEQKRKDDEDQKRRREYQQKKQREMEEWLARQHAKEEDERKRREVERIMEQQRIQQEENRARKEAERAVYEENCRREEEELRKKEEAEMRAELERKRQVELHRIEMKIKEEADLRLRRKLMENQKQEKQLKSEKPINGDEKEVEMDIEDGHSPILPKDELLTEDYPPPPSDALLPAKLPAAHYTTASNEPAYSSYSQGSSGAFQTQLSEASSFTSQSTSLSSYKDMAYQHRFTPPPSLQSSAGTASIVPPFSSSSGTLPPPISTMTPPILPPIKLEPAVIAVTPPTHLSVSLPPPPMPPAIGLPIRLPSDPPFPPHIPPTITPTNVVPVVAVPLPGVIVAATPPTVRSGSDSQKGPPTQFVRIANTPFGITETQIREFFQGLTILPNAIQFLTKNGRRTGHVFIKFASEEDAVKAALKNKMKLCGREILVLTATRHSMDRLLQKIGSQKFEDLFSDDIDSSPQTSGASRPPRSMDDKILAEKLTCVRLGSLPANVIPEDIMKTFDGISVMPNGIHVLHTIDGKCNGSGFVELVTTEDCLRAAKMHVNAEVNGALIRVMPIGTIEMKNEIKEHNVKVFGPPPTAALPPSSVPMPFHDDIRLRPPFPPMPPVFPPRAPGIRMPIPPVPMPDHEFALRHPDFRGPPIDMRGPPLPHMMPPPGRPRRTPTPPHLKMHRPPSPSRGMPQRPRSPPRAPSPGRMNRRSPSPSMRPRSPMMPQREMEFSRQEMERRAEMDELNRRIDHERAAMRDNMHRRNSFEGRPRFPMDGPRFGFERPPFPGDMPRLPPGMPRFPGDMPPRFMGDGPRFPMDMPRFRMPFHDIVPVKMSNLSFHITQEDILEFFMKFAPIPDSVRLLYNPTGKLTGDGLISFPSRDAAESAIGELQQKPLLSRKIKLALG